MIRWGDSSLAVDEEPRSTISAVKMEGWENEASTLTQTWFEMILKDLFGFCDERSERGKGC